MSLVAALISFLSILDSNARADDAWFCKEGASEKRGQIITSCGVDTDPTETGARKKALTAAFEELDAICGRSADCKHFELEIEPLRNDCKKESGGYKCYRAVRATITDKKRKEPYQKGTTLTSDREKIDVTVKIDPRELVALTQSAEPRCKADLAPLSQALLDISTKDKQNALAQEAVKVPMDELCASIHYKVLGILSRNRINLPVYTAFLIKTLEQIRDPSSDERAFEILDYFQRIGPMDENQWRASMEIIKRSPTFSLYRLLPRLFFDQAMGEAQQKLEKQRVDLFVEAVRKQEIGKPMPLKMDEAMELLLRALNRTNPAPWLAIYAYERHRESLPMETPYKLAKSLTSLYRATEDAAMKDKVNAWIADLVKKAAPSYELSRELAQYLADFESSIKKQDDEEDEGAKRIKMYRAQRAEMISRSGPNLGKNLSITRQDYERQARMALCLDLGLKCEELVPDQERLSKLLKSKKSQKRLEALDVLIKSPKIAKQLEGELLSNLKEADEGKIDNSGLIVDQTVLALAEIPTQNQEILKFLVDLRLQSRLSLQHVWAKLGPGLEPFLLKELKGHDNRHHLEIIMELEELPKLSKPTCAHLRALMTQEQPYYIKDEAEKAVRKCR